jgi:hypothetical protein
MRGPSAGVGSSIHNRKSVIQTLSFFVFISRTLRTSFHQTFQRLSSSRTRTMCDVKSTEIHFIQYPEGLEGSPLSHSPSLSHPPKPREHVRFKRACTSTCLCCVLTLDGGCGGCPAAVVLRAQLRHFTHDAIKQTARQITPVFFTCVGEQRARESVIEVRRCCAGMQRCRHCGC